MAYLAPDTIGGIAFLAPDEPPVIVVTPPVVVINGGGGGGPVREVRAYAAQFDRIDRNPKPRPKPKAKPPEKPKKKHWRDYLPN
jgi:hypothetical protein